MLESKLRAALLQQCTTGGTEECAAALAALTSSPLRLQCLRRLKQLRKVETLGRFFALLCDGGAGATVGLKELPRLLQFASQPMLRQVFGLATRDCGAAEPIGIASPPTHVAKLRKAFCSSCTSAQLQHLTRTAPAVFIDLIVAACSSGNARLRVTTAATWGSPPDVILLPAAPQFASPALPRDGIPLSATLLTLVTLRGEDALPACKSLLTLAANLDAAAEAVEDTAAAQQPTSCAVLVAVCTALASRCRVPAIEIALQVASGGSSALVVGLGLTPLAAGTQQKQQRRQQQQQANIFLGALQTCFRKVALHRSMRSGAAVQTYLVPLLRALLLAPSHEWDAYGRYSSTSSGGPHALRIQRALAMAWYADPALCERDDFGRIPLNSLSLLPPRIAEIEAKKHLARSPMGPELFEAVRTLHSASAADIIALLAPELRHTDQTRRTGALELLVQCCSCGCGSGGSGRDSTSTSTGSGPVDGGSTSAGGAAIALCATATRVVDVLKYLVTQTQRLPEPARASVLNALVALPLRVWRAAAARQSASTSSISTSVPAAVSSPTSRELAVSSTSASVFTSLGPISALLDALFSAAFCAIDVSRASVSAILSLLSRLLTVETSTCDAVLTYSQT